MAFWILGDTVVSGLVLAFVLGLVVLAGFVALAGDFFSVVISLLSHIFLSYETKCFIN